MHLKLKAYCFGVPLLYTLLIISLFSLDCCEPFLPAHSFQPTSSSDPYNVRSSVLTTRVPSNPSMSAVTLWSYLSGSRSEKLANGDRTKTKPPETESELGTEGRMASSSSLTPHYKRRQTGGERLFISHKLPDGNCSRGTIRHVVPGKFYITGQLETNHRHGAYQVDSAATVQVQEASSIGEHLGGSVESWQNLEPSVECGDDAMTLTVRRKRAIQLLLDQVNGSSLPLAQLPQQCGYSVRSSWKDLTLMAQYDACHVIREDDGYVLPLLWMEIPVKVFCPVSQLKPEGEGPSSLCCYPNSMTVELRGPSAMKNTHINVRGEWTPLGMLVEQCGYTLERRAAETVIAVPFITCGTTVKDGKSTLLLRMGKEIFMLACPNPAFQVPTATHESLADGSPDLTRKLPKPKLESLGPFLFVPPFYLAPPYHPHPTYHYSYFQNKEQDLYKPPPHSLASKADSTSQLSSQDHYYQQISLKDAYEHFMTQKPLSSKDQLESSGSFHKDKKQTHVAPLSDLSRNSVTPTGLPVQVESPHFQHPNHDFGSFYPKIPFPGILQGLGPGVPGPRTSDSQNHQLPSMLPDIQQPQGLKEGTKQVSSPVTTQTKNKVTAVHSPYLPQPFPYHFYFYPHITMGEAKRLGLFHLDWAAKANMSSSHPAELANQEKQNVIPNRNKPDKETDVHPSFSSRLQDNDGNKLSSSVTPAVQSPAPQRPDPVAVPPDKPVVPTPGFTHNADPYKYYYHPYYNYYLKYYAPEALHGVYNHLAQTSVQQPSHSKYQTSSPPSEPVYGSHNRLMLPYYYYNLNYLPQLFRYYQKQNHPGSKDSDKGSTSLLSSNLDYAELQRFPRASEGGQSGPQLSLSNTFNPPYSNYITWHPRGHGAKEKLDDFMRDGPAGLDFVFAVPDSLLDPSAALPAPSSGDRKLSCMLQKRSSDPDIYIVPLDGCRVNKDMSGQKMIHESEVQGILSNRDRGYFPVRLMVGCSSPSGSHGQVRLHKTGRSHLPSTAPTPSVVTVVLRIATDASFAKFYPKAHLPISLMQGKPVHVELRLLGPAQSNLVLLVHSCLAYTLTPDVNWMLFYDGCSSQSVSQKLPSPDPWHIWRLKVSSFPSLPPPSYTYMAYGGPSAPEDPEVYFLCHTELCSTVYGECGLSCNKEKGSDPEGPSEETVL